MAFLGDATISKKQIRHINKQFINATLQNTNLYNKAIDINSFPIINSIHCLKRSSLCTSYPISKNTKLKASVTVEAALAFPIFFFVVMSLIYIMNIMYIQTTLQIALEDTVRTVSDDAYVSTKFYSLSVSDQINALDKDSSIVEDLGAKVISATYLKNVFLTDKMKSMLDSSPIYNGSDGISFLYTAIDLNANIADVVLTYNLTIPFIPKDIASFTLANRCYIHLFTGTEMTKEQTSADTYVYYTTTGSVYHFNRFCKYLLDYTEATNYLNINNQLTQCALCKTLTLEELQEQNPIVYVTQSKYCYHTTLKCQSFTSMVFRMHTSSLEENANICKECLKGK